jgi:hypothetical protein
MYLCHHNNLPSLVVEKFLTVVAKNAAQGVRHNTLKFRVHQFSVMTSA